MEKEKKKIKELNKKRKIICPLCGGKGKIEVVPMSVWEIYKDYVDKLYKEFKKKYYL